MTSSFPTASSAPPASTPSRLGSNNQFNRVSTNQQNTSRLKSGYDNRRYSNVAPSSKRPVQPSITPNPRSVPVLSRIEMGVLPPPPSSHQQHLGLQHQMSSPGRLQRQTVLSPGSSPLIVPVTTMAEPMGPNRTRPGPLLPPNVRNAIHRNAVSLNTLSSNNQSGTMNRGRSQNSSHRGSMSNRTARLRQQSLAGFDLQHTNTVHPPTTITFRNNPVHADPPPVFFE